MKKIFKYVFLLGAFSIVCTSSFSQKFVGGPKAGIAFTQVDGDGYGGYHKVGFNLGGFVYRPVSKNQKWDLQFEIEYIQKGSRKTPDYDTGDLDDYKLTLNYIQLPILLRYNMRHISLEGGVSIGSLFASKEVFNELEGGDPFKTMEFAVLLGLNYHFNPKLWISGRYSISLSRIREPYEGSVPGDLWGCRKPGQYNNILAVSIFYAFNGSHKMHK
jgi:hypothetical protein